MISKCSKILLIIACAIAGFFLVFTSREEVQSEFGEAAQKALRATGAYHAFRWYNDQRAHPTGTIPVHWREKALKHINRYILPVLSKTSSLIWTSVGPNNIGGRVRSIAINPKNPDVIYCGSVSGGIWKSTNGGLSWVPLTDFANNLVIGAIVIDPTDTNIIYAGTGEGYFNVDALRGIGVLKSTDAGQTWIVLNNFLNTAAPHHYYFINKLVIRPDNPNVLYAALIGGVWKTTDAGASWTRILSRPTTSSSFCMDLVANPTNPDVMYASFGLFSEQSDGIYKTTNGGGSWVRLSNGFPPRSEKFGRISLAIAPSNPSVLYACLMDSNNYTHSIQKTTNGGQSWFAVETPFDNSPAVNGTHLGGQGWYNNVIAVHPTNPDIVFTGGINMFKSVNGGVGWTRISDGYGSPYMHVDHHAIVFHPTNFSIIYFGTDGGVFKSTDGGVNFLDMNSGFVTTQFYSGAVHPTQEIYYGGTQDNGTLKSTSTPAWSMVLGGDGGATAVDYVNPNNVYTEYIYLSFRRSTNAGATWTLAMNGIPKNGDGSSGTSDRCAFIAPFVMDPSNPQVIVAGTYRVFRTTNGGLSWTAISNDLTGDGAGGVGSFGSVISAIAIAKTSSAVIYVGTSGSGTSPSKILVTTNTGQNWGDSTKNNLPNRTITSIAIDPTNANRAFIGYSGYNANTPTKPGHIFLTTNLGASWTDVSGDLPDIPVNAIILDPQNKNHLLVGTDLGIFETSNCGANWLQQNSGMANVSIADLDLRQDRHVVAATHGRGMFRTATPWAIIPSPVLSISVHQNPVLTRYADIYVASSESLSTVPTMQVSINNAPPISLAIQQHSWRIFKASYEFTESGSITISVTALDYTGTTLSTSRTFAVQLLKRGITQIVSSSDGIAQVTVASDALNEDTYFTVLEELKDDYYMNIVTGRYTFGPKREFQIPLMLAMQYNDNIAQNRDVRSLCIYQMTSDGWKPLKSWVDVNRKRVSTSISSLGTFAMGINENTLSELVPESFVLEQNYPNPFNAVTKISFNVGYSSSVSLRVYDMLGREVAVLANEVLVPGIHTRIWDATNSSSGVYFYTLSATTDNEVKFVQTKKMLLIK